MGHTTSRKKELTLSQIMEVSCRIDFRSLPADTFSEHTGRLESISAAGCTIRTSQHPESWDALELRIYLPGLSSPLRIDHAKVIWGRSDAFTVGYLALAVAEQLRLRDYLTDADFFVARHLDSILSFSPMPARRICDPTLQ